MNADITPEMATALRGRALAGGSNYAWRLSECLSVLDALESSRAEVQRLQRDRNEARAKLEQANALLDGIRKVFGSLLTQDYKDSLEAWCEAHKRAIFAPPGWTGK